MLYKFEDFKKINENTEDKSFTEKVAENFAFLDIIKTAITAALTGHEINNVTNDEELRSWFDSTIYFDGSSIVDLDVDEKLDLCIYYGEEGGEKTIPSGTEWDSFYEVLSNTAVNGIYSLSYNIISDFINELNMFVEENELEYDKITGKELYGYAAPTKVRDIENGEVYEYRNIDGDFNVDEYIFTDSKFGIEVYISKKI